MARQFWNVIEALNAQQNGNWFIVGSYAAWIYLVTSPNRPHWSQEEWRLVAPGDIDIAISYPDAREARIAIDGGNRNKVALSLPHVPHDCRALCGVDKAIDEVEFVYNDTGNGMHRDASVVANILRLVPIRDLVARLNMGSAKGDLKDRARLKRAAGLKAAYSDLFPKATVGMGSLFGDIAKFKFEKK